MPARTCGGAVEVEIDLVVLDLDADLEGQRAVELVALVDVLERIDAGGDGADAGARQAFGVIEQRIAGRQQQVLAVAVAEALEALDALAVGGHLRAQVVQALARHLQVEQHEIEDVLHQLAFAIEPHGRNANAFLEDVRMAAIDEVGVMGRVGGPGDQLAFVEDRLGEHDVGQVRAAAGVGVVAHEDVAFADVLHVEALGDLLDDADQRAEMDRDVRGLAQRAALGIEQARRAVAPLLDVGRVGGAHQRLAHLLDDGGQRIADDLDGDGIDRSGEGRLRGEATALIAV